MNYINNKVRKGEDVKIELDNGEAIYITGRTAWKMGDQGDLGNDIYLVKGNAAGVIDEIVQTSKLQPGKRGFSESKKEHSGGFGKDGWNYRTAYFRDLDGKYYRMTLSVGITDGKKEAYNLKRIEETTFPGNPVNGSKAPMEKSSLHSNSITPSGDSVNSHSMQEGKNYYGEIYQRKAQSLKPMEAGNLLNTMVAEGYISEAEAERYRNVSLRVRASGEAAGATESQIREAERLSHATGREVIFLGNESSVTFPGKDVSISRVINTEEGEELYRQGFANGNVIYIYPGEGAVINQVLAEEFIHTIEGTESYKEFASFVKTLAKAEGFNEEAEKKDITDIYEKSGVPFDTEREYVSKMAARLLFTDPESVDFLVKNRQGIASRLYSFLSETAARLTGNDEKETTLRARRLLSDALSESKKNPYAKAEGVKYSVSYPFNKQVEDALGNKMKSGYSVYIGKTPNLLVKCGLPPELPMLMNQGHLRDINAPKDPNNIHLHGIDKNIIKRLPTLLKNPVMIFNSISEENKENSVCVLTSLKNGDGEPIIISIKYSEADSKYLDVEFVERKTDKSNFVTSMYGKKSFTNHLKDVLDADAVLYVHKSGIEKVLDEKNKTLKLNADSKLQLLTRLDNLGFDTIIHKSRNVVNSNSMQEGEKYSSGEGISQSVSRGKKATMEDAQALFNEMAYNGTLTNIEELNSLYKRNPELFKMLQEVTEGERTIAEESKVDYIAPFDEAIFLMGLVEETEGYTSEDVAESEEAAGINVSDMAKEGLLNDAQYAIACSKGSHESCGEILKGVNRLIPGAFGLSKDEVSEIKTIWQRAYEDPEGYRMELMSSEQLPGWNVPENGDTVSERAVNSIKNTLGLEESDSADEFIGGSFERTCYTLVNMESVADLTGKELEGPEDLKTRIKKLFEKLGNRVRTDRFGDVELSNSSVRSEIRHGTTPDKVNSYAAIPQVLKKGVVIDVRTEGQGKFEKVVVAAPITIAGKPFYMGIMLKRDKLNQRLYLHDVIIKKEGSVIQHEHLNTTGPADDKNLYMTDILEKAVSVGNYYTLNPEKRQEAGWKDGIDEELFQKTEENIILFFKYKRELTAATCPQFRRKGTRSQHSTPATVYHLPAILSRLILYREDFLYWKLLLDRLY